MCMYINIRSLLAQAFNVQPSRETEREEECESMGKNKSKWTSKRMDERARTQRSCIFNAIYFVLYFSSVWLFALCVYCSRSFFIHSHSLVLSLSLFSKLSAPVCASAFAFSLYFGCWEWNTLYAIQFSIPCVCVEIDVCIFLFTIISPCVMYQRYIYLFIYLLFFFNSELSLAHSLSLSPSHCPSISFALSVLLLSILLLLLPLMLFIYILLLLLLLLL